jgi:Domain of unknown function (DUF4388)
MQLEGQAAEISLPEVFRLLRMSRKTGILKVVNGRHWGDVYFREGEIYDVDFPEAGPFLGEQLVRAGEIGRADLASVLAQQRGAQRPVLLRSLLLERELVAADTLVPFLRELIEDVAFTVFGWKAAEFHFIHGLEPIGADLVLSLDAEGVLMEGCRRLDEWDMIMQGLGSLEKVPHLTPSTRGAVTLKRHEWDVVCYLDGHRDINTIARESGLERFHTAKTIHDLMTAGLLVTRDPTLELLGQKTAIALRGPIDIYSLSFLTSVCTSDITSHLRVEMLNDEEVEIHISAGVREEGDEGALVYFSEAQTPLPILRRMALETSGYILLVNINSRDSVVVSRKDIVLMAEIGDRPYVVASYSSMIDEKVSEEWVRELLGLADKVPVVACNIRDPEETSLVFGAITDLLP